MTEERAREIVAACIATVHCEMGIVDRAPSIADYSLAEMVEAQRVVEEADRGPGRIPVVCDDRLVAALYVAAHYPGQSPKKCQPITVVGSVGVFALDVSPNEDKNEDTPPSPAGTDDLTPFKSPLSPSRN